MSHQRTPAVCVFCGQAIGPDDAVSGRPPMAGHASCADAALADDAHWDEVASYGTDAPEEEEAPSAPETAERGRGGCLTVSVVLIVALALVPLV